MRKKVMCFLVTILLLCSFITLFSYPALAEGYWELSTAEKYVSKFDGWGHGTSGGLIELSNGYASFYKQDSYNDWYYQPSVKWSSPPERLYPGEKIFLSATLKNEECRTNEFVSFEFNMYFMDTSGYCDDIIYCASISGSDGKGAARVFDGESTVPDKNYGRKGYGDPPGVMYIKADCHFNGSTGINYVYVWHGGGGSSGGSSGFIGVAGVWSISANGYPGELELTVSDGEIQGRIYFEGAGNWETLTSISYNSGTGELKFTRPWSNNPKFQQYSGHISGSSISGTFTDVNQSGKSFPWSGTKI